MTYVLILYILSCVVAGSICWEDCKLYISRARRCGPQYGPTFGDIGIYLLITFVPVVNTIFAALGIWVTVMNLLDQPIMRYIK